MVICRRKSAESGNAFHSEDGDAHELVPGRLRGGSARSGRLCRTRVTKRYPSAAADAAGVRTFGYPRRVLPPERVLVDRGRRRPQLHNLWEPGGMLDDVVRVDSLAQTRNDRRRTARTAPAPAEQQGRPVAGDGDIRLHDPHRTHPAPREPETRRRRHHDRDPRHRRRRPVHHTQRVARAARRPAAAPRIHCDDPHRRDTSAKAFTRGPDVHRPPGRASRERAQRRHSRCGRGHRYGAERVPFPTALVHDFETPDGHGTFYGRVYRSRAAVMAEQIVVRTL
ncbi:hypothetical protein CMMCAS05_10475 [Clavibacter michiganensis subsp. michiganensis]|nr:hypothetical protein CMMCAS05_10475 [Clavibacter michiganensis subsp. michiganensis]OUE11410.1 hypothetical protein CMMCAY01_00265 [Clavibacter michiganensis subsp. michiganensis]